MDYVIVWSVRIFFLLIELEIKEEEFSFSSHFLMKFFEYLCDATTCNWFCERRLRSPTFYIEIY